MPLKSCKDKKTRKIVKWLIKSEILNLIFKKFKNREVKESKQKQKYRRNYIILKEEVIRQKKI